MILIEETRHATRAFSMMCRFAIRPYKLSKSAWEEDIDSLSSHAHCTNSHLMHYSVDVLVRRDHIPMRRRTKLPSNGFNYSRTSSIFINAKRLSMICYNFIREKYYKKVWNMI